MGSAASVPVEKEDNKVGNIDMYVQSTQCVRDMVVVLQENEGTQEKRLEEAFRKMDSSSDSLVDIKEWRKFIKNKGSLHDDDAIRNTLKSMDVNGDGKITLDDLRSHASTNGLLVSRILSSFRPTESQLAQATSVVLDEFSKFQRFLWNNMNDSPPVRSFDEETLQMMKEGEIDATKIDGNSNCWWDHNSELKTFRDSVLNRFLAVCGNYEPNEKQLKCTKHVLLGWFVRRMFKCRKDRNVGAVVLRDMFDECGRPIVLFRSQVMAYSGSCFQDLLNHGRVRSVHNIYAGTFPVHDWIEMERRESKISVQPPSTYFDERVRRRVRKWRRMVDNYDKSDERVKRNAMILCARQIVQILRSCAKGNALVHCAGGMHRTGMLVGIIRRYVLMMNLSGSLAHTLSLLDIAHTLFLQVHQSRSYRTCGGRLQASCCV